MSERSIIMTLPIPIPIRLTKRGEEILKKIGDKSTPYLAELFEKAKEADSLYMLWHAGSKEAAIAIDENGGVAAILPKKEVVIKQDEFKPVPVMLSPHGYELVNASANFREAERIYMLKPPFPSGSIMVGVGKKGSVYMFVPENDVLGLFYEK